MTTIGILGAGQLGRMLSLAGFPLGFNFKFYAEQKNAATEYLGQTFTSNEKNLRDFLASIDVVSYETENTSLELAQQIAETCPLRPGIKSLQISQNRSFEKSLFTQLNIPTVNYQIVQTQAELEEAAQKLGLPFILKTITEGYDGKGQSIIRSDDDIAHCLQPFNGKQLIAEAFLDFDYEVSQVAVRNQNKSILFYPLSHNAHQQGILRFSYVSDATSDANLTQQAQGYVTQVLEALDHVGVFTLEFFVKNNQLFANEMAPRVHNSGHWTMNGAQTCQFENHIRAITDLPLGSTKMTMPYNLMVNLIGEIPPKQALLNIDALHLHDYAKEAKPGRKVGHLNINTQSQKEMIKAVNALPQSFKDSLSHSSLASLLNL